MESSIFKIHKFKTSTKLDYTNKIIEAYKTWTNKSAFWSASIYKNFATYFLSFRSMKLSNLVNFQKQSPTLSPKQKSKLL